IADALDAAAVKTAVGRIRPDAVINELTSLPRHYTPAEMKAAAERDRKVRAEGNINLLAALRDAGVRRYLRVLQEHLGRLASAKKRRFVRQEPARSTTRRGLGALRTRRRGASLSFVRARSSGFRSNPK